MTINNPTPTDEALISQGYSDFLKQLVYQHEVGEDGTPHIQAYVRLYRQQRLSYMKKLFPRGHFTCITADEYNLNSQRYAQKNDATRVSQAVITNNIFPDATTELLEVLKVWIDRQDDWPALRALEGENETTHLLRTIPQVETWRVFKNPKLAKFYISASYNKMKNQFAQPMLDHLLAQEDAFSTASTDTSHSTHTHTTQEVVVPTSIPDEASKRKDVRPPEGEEDEDYASSESEEDVSDASGSGSECSEDGDCSDF